MQFAVEEALMAKLGVHERHEHLRRETEANVKAAQARVEEARVANRRRDKLGV